MNNDLTLPPYVHGKVLGFLKLFVEEIEIFKRNIHLKNESDIVAQVQWWGETLPVFHRPGKIHLLNRYFTNTIQEPIIYKIKTNFNLFRLYLEMCEVSEIAFLDIDKNCIFGSAFFNNLKQILEKNDTLKILPLVDYQGDIIGNVKIHIELSEEFIKKDTNYNSNEKHIILVQSECSSTGKAEHNKILSIFGDCQEKNKVNSKIEKIKPKFQIPIKVSNKLDVKLDNVKTASKNISQSKQRQRVAVPFDISLNKNQFQCSSCDSSNSYELDSYKNYQTTEAFPEIQMKSDFSKIISVDLKNCGQIQKRNEKNKKQSFKTTDKKVSPRIPLNIPKVVPSLYVSNNKDENNTRIDTNKLKTKPIVAKKQKDSKLNGHASKNKKIIKKTPSDGSVTNSGQSSKNMVKNVLDYLFGCDMSKEDEEDALSGLIKMSPCHDLVRNITKLYSGLSTTSSSSEKTSKPYSNEKSCTIKMFKTCNINENSMNPKKRIVSYLKYNFDDPVERQYYNKFFMKNENSHGLEIAEIINEREYDLDKEKTSNISTYQSESKYDRDIITSSYLDKENSDKESSLNLESESTKGGICDDVDGKSCGDCCQYYKKLNELDKIIESLNHYEKKILTEEKLSNEANLF